MYEMYPEVWALADARRSAAGTPRRRPRREHCVLPPVIARQVAAAEERHVAG